MKRFLLITLLTICHWPVLADDRPRVVDGLIDLSEWDFVKQGPVNLRGEYEFYWQQFLSSEDFLRINQTEHETLRVPGEWNGKIVDGEAVGGYGYATYRLNIVNSYRLPLALKVPDLGTTFRLYVDGQLLLQAGRPGTSRQSSIPEYNPSVVTFTPTSTRVEVILQISNYHHRLGGAWLPIYLGTPQQLITLRENQLARDLILFGAILILGLYNLVLFILRPDNRSSLFLGLFCLLLAIRQLMVGDRFMTRIVPDMTFEWYIRIEYLGWYLAGSSFMAFLNHIFPDERQKYASIIIHTLFAVGALIVALTPTWIFSFTVPVYQFITLAAMAYGTWILILSVMHRREGSSILLFAYAVFYLTTISDMLVNAGVFGNVLLLDLGLFVFVLCQSILISYRFTRAFETVETQRSQLAATNLKLRTQEKLRRDAEQESEALHQRIVQSEKMEAIGLLAGGVAHDLNNILSNTVTYPELALLDLPKDSPLAKPLEMTRQAGLRAAAVIQDMLTLARRGVVQREVLNVNQVIDDYLQSVEYKHLMSSIQGIEIDCQLADDLLNVEGSRVHIGKLVMNLVSNAAEAMPEGGRVSISTHNEEVRHRELFYMPIKDGTYVVLSIEDDGIGIDPDDLDHLFEPFYTTKVLGQSGTGLGMSVVWGVVYDHAGGIDVMSEQGVGTRFDIYLPATRQPLPEAPAPSPLAKLMGQGESILVVDDLQDQRELTTAVLERLNYKVTTCATGQEALDQLKENDFDLVILDMVTNDEWDGLQSFREIISLKPDIRTLLVSGFAETEQVAEAQQLGAGPFLRKPFTLEGIGSRIKSLLG